MNSQNTDNYLHSSVFLFEFCVIPGGASSEILHHNAYAPSVICNL